MRNRVCEEGCSAQPPEGYVYCDSPSEQRRCSFAPCSSLELELELASSSPSSTCPTPYTDYAGALSLVDDAGSTYENPQSYSDLPDQLTEMQIALGDKRSGWVYFEVPAKRTPRLAQFTANSMNVDYSRTQIGEWSLE